MVEDPRLLFPPAPLQLFDQAGHVSLVPVTLGFNVLNKAEIKPRATKCCGSGMFIPDLNFLHPGSRIKKTPGFRIQIHIRIKEFKYDC
jgi:hypothetical protein